MTAEEIACTVPSSPLSRHLPFDNEGKCHTGLVKMSLVLKDVHKRRPCFVRVDDIFQGMLSRMQMHLFEGRTAVP